LEIDRGFEELLEAISEIGRAHKRGKERTFLAS